ncbi:MAG TPA: MFS transporter [Actinocrinis sp.]
MAAAALAEADGPKPGPNPAAARRLRVLITLFFLLDGFVFANWVVRVPQVKAHVGASPATLGLALLGVSIGAIATMTITGRLCDRFGSRAITVATAVLLAFSVALPAIMPTVLALGGALFFFGAGWGGLNVAMNSAAVNIIAELDQPIMPSFHAAYSLGGLLGSVVGGVVAEFLGAAAHLAGVGVVGLAATIALGIPLMRCAPLETEHAQSAEYAQRAERAQRQRRGHEPEAAKQRPRGEPGDQAAHAARQLTIIVYIFSVIALCSSYGEGALADWGALHLRTDLHTSAGMAAAGYACFSVAMFIGRLSGSWVLRTVGRTAVLAGGGLTAAGGMLVAALVPTLAIVLVGFVLVGFGLSNMFPATVGQAGVLRGPAGVATASTFGYGGFLTGPPLIGFLADRLGLPIALTSISALAAVAATIALLAAGWVRAAETVEQRPEPDTAPQVSDAAGVSEVSEVCPP